MDNAFMQGPLDRNMTQCRFLLRLSSPAGVAHQHVPARLVQRVVTAHKFPSTRFQRYYSSKPMMASADGTSFYFGESQPKKKPRQSRPWNEIAALVRRRANLAMELAPALAKTTLPMIRRLKKKKKKKKTRLI